MMNSSVALLRLQVLLAVDLFELSSRVERLCLPLTRYASNHVPLRGSVLLTLDQVVQHPLIPIAKHVAPRSVFGAMMPQRSEAFLE